MKPQRLFPYVIGATAMLLVVIGCVVTPFTLIHVPFYPNPPIAQEIPDTDYEEYGVRRIVCSPPLKGGIVFFTNRLQYAHATFETTKRWAKQLGWNDFVIKGHDEGVVYQDEVSVSGINAVVWKRLGYSDMTDFTRLNVDSTLTVCWR